MPCLLPSVYRALHNGRCLRGGIPDLSNRFVLGNWASTAAGSCGGGGGAHPKVLLYGHCTVGPCTSDVNFVQYVYSKGSC